MTKKAVRQKPADMGVRAKKMSKEPPKEAQPQTEADTEAFLKYVADNVPPEITDDFPVCGFHLEVLRRRLGLTVADVMWLFGMDRYVWSQRKVGRAPVKDLALAAYARLLWRFPELCPIRQAIPLDELLALLRDQLGEVTLAELAFMFGRSTSTSIRWVGSTGSSNTTVVVSRMADATLRAMHMGVDPRQLLSLLMLRERTSRQKKTPPTIKERVESAGSGVLDEMEKALKRKTSTPSRKHTKTKLPSED